MHQIVAISISELLLDDLNPRLEDGSGNQQEIAIKLAKQQGENNIRLAEDIVESGLDPINLTAIVATEGARKRYRVLEGNRRLLALRSLETPSLVASVLTKTSLRKLNDLSAKYAINPIENLNCVLFDSEDEALHWIQLRHTGQNLGVGLVDWGASEKDRFKARHAGTRNPAGQIIDFVYHRGELSIIAKKSTKKIQTNVERLISSPSVREKLGIDIADGRVLSHFPESEIDRILTKIVDDLLTEKIKVQNLYTVEQRIKYVEGLPKSLAPKKNQKLANPVFLDDLTAGKKILTPVPKKTVRRVPKPVNRTTVIQRQDNLEVNVPRLNAIYSELRELNAETYTNACSVLLRVFIELSVDVYIERQKIVMKSVDRATLAEKLRETADHLFTLKEIGKSLKDAINAIANSQQSILAPGVKTFHGYVHNPYIFPKAKELYTAWDEISPLLAKIYR